MDQQNTNILLDISDSRDTAQRADVPDRNERQSMYGLLPHDHSER